MASKKKANKESMEHLKAWRAAKQQAKQARAIAKECQAYFQKELEGNGIESTLLDGSTIERSRSSVSVKSKLDSVSSQEAKRRLIEALQERGKNHLLTIGVNTEAIHELLEHGGHHVEELRELLSLLNIELVENHSIKLN